MEKGQTAIGENAKSKQNQNHYMCLEYVFHSFFSDAFLGLKHLSVSELQKTCLQHRYRLHARNTIGAFY